VRVVGERRPTAVANTEPLNQRTFRREGAFGPDLGRPRNPQVPDIGELKDDPPAPMSASASFAESDERAQPPTKLPRTGLSDVDDLGSVHPIGRQSGEWDRRIATPRVSDRRRLNPGRRSSLLPREYVDALGTCWNSCERGFQFREAHPPHKAFGDEGCLCQHGERECIA
jgi:hypothetical protein